MIAIALGFSFGLGLSMILGCFIPKRLLPRKMPHDGFLHIAAFGLLSFPIGLGIDGIPRIIAYSMGLFLFGIFVELCQILVPDRRFGWDDVAYNAAGIVLGILLGKALQWSLFIFSA